MRELIFALSFPSLLLLYLACRNLKSRKEEILPGILYIPGLERKDVHAGHITVEQAENWLKLLADCYVTYVQERFARNSQNALTQFYADYRILREKGLVSKSPYAYLARGEHKIALCTVGCIN